MAGRLGRPQTHPIARGHAIVPALGKPLPWEPKSLAEMEFGSQLRRLKDAAAGTV